MNCGLITAGRADCRSACGAHRCAGVADAMLRELNFVLADADALTSAPIEAAYGKSRNNRIQLPPPRLLTAPYNS